MSSLLEAAAADPMPYNIAVGVGLFVTLCILMAIVHGIGASHPHS